MNRRPLALQRRLLFLDSSGYLALINPRDLHHQEARTVWERVSKQGWRTFTTNFVVAETHALFLARLGRFHAAAFLRQLPQSSTTIERVTHGDEEQARQIVFRYEDKDFTLTDAASFVTMERLGILLAFSFDRDFEQYGFRLATAAVL